MTTIALKDGVLACDKQGTNYGTISTCAAKMVHSDSSVYCFCGTLTTGLKFINWLLDEQRGKAPSIRKTCVVEMDKKTGAAYVWEDNIPIKIEDSVFATGSGGDVALGAMEAGATPEEAIKIATKWDTHTGKGVQVVVSKAAAKRRARSG